MLDHAVPLLALQASPDGSGGGSRSRSASGFKLRLMLIDGSPWAGGSLFGSSASLGAISNALTRLDINCTDHPSQVDFEVGGRAIVLLKNSHVL